MVEHLTGTSSLSYSVELEIMIITYFFSFCPSNFTAHFFQVTIGQRRGISAIDAKQMNLLYKTQCSGGGRERNKNNMYMIQLHHFIANGLNQYVEVDRKS